jgi:hypothetical protein
MGKIDPNSVSQKCQRFLDEIAKKRTPKVTDLYLEFSDTKRDTLQKTFKRWQAFQQPKPAPAPSADTIQEVKTKAQKHLDVDLSPDPSVEIDESFKKLIAYNKYALQQNIDIAPGTILQHLSKTEQLKTQEVEIFQYVELFDKFSDMVEKFLNSDSAPKAKELLEL